MKTRNKNPVLRTFIDAHKASGIPVWKAVARSLNRPRRIEHKVNLYRIERYAKPKDILVVPGVVLGSGDVKKPLEIGAMKFSRQARERIEKAGGKCLSIEELMEKHPKGSRIRILG